MAETTWVAGGSHTTETAAPELARWSRWLIRLRWLAAVGIGGCAMVAAGPLGYPVPTRPLVALGLVVALYNAVLWLVHAWLIRMPTAPPQASAVLANTQIALDLVALAVLVHLAGGIENPFAIYFVFHMIIASILLSPRAAYAQAALAWALYAGVVAGEQLGLLRHLDVFASRGPAYSDLDVAGHIAVMGSALLVAVFLTTTIAARLRQREHELARALDEVQRQAGQCELARANLEQTQEMRLRYMRRVSHELRGPLASIAMVLRVVRDRLEDEAPAKLREMIGRAEARTETLLDLVDDLLTLSQMREAPLQEPFREVVVAALVDDVLASLADIAAHNDVTLTARVDPGLPVLHGQPESLRTMLLNLVGNGVKYTPSGGRVAVSAAYAPDAEEIVLTVSDTGAGIAAADLPRLFEEFFRADTARQSPVHGTGLGLSIVKLTIDAHHGTITVDSQEGQGSTFTVRLPMRGPSAPEGP